MGKSVEINGPNGIGKTNILEAIHLISTTKALRTKYDRELIKHEQDLARVELEVDTQDEIEKLEMAIVKSNTFENASKKLVKINKTPKALHLFTSTLNTVLFTPSDIEILSGSPSLRRHYFDSILYQVNKNYKTRHMEYTKVVRQRNKVLERISERLMGKRELDFWDTKLLELGSYVTKERQKLVNYIQQQLPQHMAHLNSKDNEYNLEYIASELSEEKLNIYNAKEIAARTTLIGPHRDDFIITFNGRDIGYFGSRGQQRTTLLGLKLCEIDFINEEVRHRPILLLDDIFSELDPEHVAAIENISKLQQTIITTAHNATDKLEIISL